MAGFPRNYYLIDEFIVWRKLRKYLEIFHKF